MMDAYQDRLIHGHLDGLLNDAERAEFSTLMRESESARRRFWDLAEVHGLARDAARLAWPEETAEVSQAIPGPPSAVRWRLAKIRPAGLIAAGLLIGVLMSGLAWAIVQPAIMQPISAPPQLLLAEGFEAGPPPLATGMPTTAGHWGGDFTELVPAQSGVIPAEGKRMLRFLHADYQGKPNPGGYISEVYRLIDLRDQRHKLADGEVVVQISALFNLAPTAADQTFHASLSLYALDAAAVTDGTLRSGAVLLDRAQAVTRRSNQVLDRDASTWQKMATDLRLPPGTDFLLLRIAVAHGPTQRTAAGHETFAAHYVDDVRLMLARRSVMP